MAPRMIFTARLPFLVYSLRYTAVATPIGIASKRLTAIVMKVAAMLGRILIAPAITYSPNRS